MRCWRACRRFSVASASLRALKLDVGLQNHRPKRAAVSRLGDEATLDLPFPQRDYLLEHRAELELGDTAFLHALLDMRRELELPLPPHRRISERRHRANHLTAPSARSSRALRRSFVQAT